MIIFQFENLKMASGRKIEKVVKKVSFIEAEEDDIEYYASIDWKESASIVEEMRRNIWSEEYKQKRKKIIRRTKLKDDRDDFE